MQQKKKPQKRLDSDTSFVALLASLQARDALEPARGEEADGGPELAE